MMSVTIEEIKILLAEQENKLDKKLDEKLMPIYDKLEVISRDLSEIRRDLGYDNLKVIKSDDKEEM